MNELNETAEEKGHWEWNRQLPGVGINNQLTKVRV